MARRTLNRRDLRAQAEAAERRSSETEDEDEEEGADDESAGEDDDEGADAQAEGGEDDDEDAPKKKPKKAKKPKAEKAPAKPRKARSAKTQRMRVIWVVFNNSHARVAAYDYPQKAEALAHAAKLTADKKSTHFVQPVKEPIEEKKE